MTLTTDHIEDADVASEASETMVAAESAGLVYVTDAEPGITRRRAGRGFSYTGPDGRRITDRPTLERIRSLVIPPAWTEVWISLEPDGHLQVVGRDARGRKQYRYHPHWRTFRDEHKYGRLAAFGAALPDLRARVDQDLSRRHLPREKVLATVVRLLDWTLIRVGNEEYARTNESFGLTTLRDDHVDVEGASVHFSFRGKSGKEHRVDIRDRRLANVIRRSQDLPGQHLFQYEDPDGVPRAIGSQDVNDYLREISGENFTAKDFRTWGGTVVAARRLREAGPFESAREANRNVVEAVRAVARHLGNTPAVARRSYIHPAVIDAYVDQSLLDLPSRSGDDGTGDDAAPPRDDLDADERALLLFLRARSGR
jgi:DNA topoisomerase-1